MLSRAGGQPRGGESTRAGNERGKGLGGLFERGGHKGVIIEAAGGGIGIRVVKELELDMGD